METLETNKSQGGRLFLLCFLQALSELTLFVIDWKCHARCAIPAATGDNILGQKSPEFLRLLWKI